MGQLDHKLTHRDLLRLLFINSSVALIGANCTSVCKVNKLKTTEKEASMGQVKSNDGTEISFLRSGSGPPLVLVHGTSSDATRWEPVLPLLNKKFTVYAINRRGRGKSGDAKEFAFQREFEDIAAVIYSINEPVNVLGHSYGAICSLEAVLLTNHLRKLIIYEPPLADGLSVDPETEKIDARIEALIEKGDREAALMAFMTEIAKIPPDEIKMLQSSATWKGKIASAHTIPRERKAVKNYKFLPERFQNVKTPTLLLLGGNSSKRAITSTEMVKSALQNSRISIMPGQRHNAMVTASHLFKNEVENFLSE